MPIGILRDCHISHTARIDVGERTPLRSVRTRLAWRRAIFVAIFLLALGGSALSLAFFITYPSTFASDITVLPGQLQDIGLIRQQSTKQLQFELLNSGDDLVQILNVGTGCACTTASLSRKDLSPGESAILTLNYNSYDSRGAISTSSIVAYQRSNEQAPRELRLRVEGKIDPEYEASPEHLEFETGVAAARPVVLSCRHCDELTIEKAACDKRFISARVLPKSSIREQAVEIVFDSTTFYSDAGPATVAIHTDNAVQPVIAIPIEVRQPKQDALKLIP